MYIRNTSSVLHECAVKCCGQRKTQTTNHMSGKRERNQLNLPSSIAEEQQAQVIVSDALPAPLLKRKDSPNRKSEGLSQASHVNVLLELTQCRYVDWGYKMIAKCNGDTNLINSNNKII